MTDDIKLPFPINQTGYYLREISSEDVRSFQKIYVKLKEHGQYYAYLWNFEIVGDAVDFNGVGERFVKEAIESRMAAPRTIYRFAISDADDTAIGYVVALLESDEHNDARLKDGCEIGYFVSPEYQGRGIATQAIAALIGEVSARLALTSFWGMAHPDNKASIKIFEKLGMRFLKETTSSLDKKFPERLLFIKELATKSSGDSATYF